ncbi:MAG: AAA family ATPase [Candidatus Anaerobiospirillum pullicola]|uniref:AAA family ATPase n=1 Tax=Candidatus Anaerobiospirillum pullicola TaxID=2838451 RepID=A0A948WXW9_9GAMM|nr:AAA family ATPase [Candidatus Anaerobiospirillum pullicola]
MESKLEQAKHLLEYYVSHLEYAANSDTNFVGFPAYIKPHVDAGDFMSQGTCSLGGSTRNDLAIAAWRDFGDGKLVSFFQSNYSAIFPETYLGWQGSSKRIILAEWEDDDSVYNNQCAAEGASTLLVSRTLLGEDVPHCHVKQLSIYSGKYSELLSSSLEELGLFDGKAPNAMLTQFWECFAAPTDDFVIRDINFLVREIGLNLLSCHRNLILTGVSGAGKTYLAQRVAEFLVAALYHYVNAADHLAKVQFHQSYDYTDFIEGLRPVGLEDGQITFVRKDGIFKSFCKRALAHKDKNFVFIIDEINRGDTSKIFGESLSAIDYDWRGVKGRVQTQLQNLVPEGDEFYEGFYVPENVYLIGTMSDSGGQSDKMDLVFRRRFLWREIKPLECLDLLSVDKLNLDQELSKNLFYEEENSYQERRIWKHSLKVIGFTDRVTTCCKNLNAAIKAEPALGAKCQLGPAYFLNTLHFIEVEGYLGLDWALERVWQLVIEPTIRTYLCGHSQQESDRIVAELKEFYSNKEPLTSTYKR